MRLPLFGLAFLAMCSSAYALEVKPVATPFTCPFTNKAPEKVDHAVRTVIYNELVRTYKEAMGPLTKHPADPNMAASRVDPVRMAALAEVSGCAALLDERASCANYFDTELGDPLSVFTSMKKNAPLRKQYEEALAHLSRPDFKRAAQSCMKLVGKR